MRVLAFRYLKVGNTLVAGLTHDVEVTETEFVAKCGRRWGRKEPGGLLPYAAVGCKDCKEPPA